MHGIGELFGSAFDDVLKRPLPAIIPAIVDLVALLVGAIVTSTALGVVLFVSAARALPHMPVAVPEALPSITQLHDASELLAAAGVQGWLALVAIALITIPFLAWAEGGFIGVLLEAYLPRRDDPLADPPVGLDALWRTFTAHGRRAFGALFVLRLLQTIVALGAIGLPRVLPYFENSLLGLVMVDAFFLYAPFIIVTRNANAFTALRESVRTVSDYLASTLVALLFGLLPLGGLAALLDHGLDLVGPPALLVGAVVLAPVGTVLTLFYLKVYLSLRPGEWLPQATEPQRVTSAHTADA